MLEGELPPFAWVAATLWQWRLNDRQPFMDIHRWTRIMTASW